MAPAYKLTYFNIRGLAEPARYILKYGNIDFEDCRIESEQWPKLKASTPFGQLPTLEHNGKLVGQSTSICRYLGNELNLAGSNNWESLEIDAVADTIVDIKTKLGSNFYEQDETIKATKRAQLVNETLPPIFEKLEQIAKKNNGHLALGKLSWVDLFFAGGMESMNIFAGKDLLKPYPNLNQVVMNVNSLPAIKEWIEIRPKTEL